MAKPKQYRWVCPRCGVGKLAPSRPRKDDVRRYCLPCSEATGRLLERLSPALERLRQERQERKRQAAKRKRVSERRRRNSYRQAAQERRQEREAALGLPHSLDWYCRRFARLEVWKDARVNRGNGKWGILAVKVKFRWGSGSGVSGHAKEMWYLLGDGSQITLTIGRLARPESVLECLLHEYAHHATYRLYGRKVNHGWEMKRLLILATEELTGRTVDAQVDAGHCYATVDPKCKEAIREWLNADALRKWQDDQDDG